jgi:hypothetical protein
VLPTISPARRQSLRLLLFATAIIGVLVGIAGTFGHLRGDPLADVRAYYDAGARLNAGLPLYPADADTNVANFYRYPPLLAIVFRPLALLPYDVVAPLWGIAMVVAFLLTLWRIGFTRNTRYAVAILALPIGWSLAIGQAQVVMTLFVALGTPAAVAVAANIKLFPVLIGLYWLGRRDWRSLRDLVLWGLGLLAVQFVLEPNGTIAFLRFPSLDQVGQVNNLSPYGISPILWAVLVVAGALLTIRLAPSKWGWGAAVVFSVLAMPRLFSYQFMTFLAGLRRPDADVRRDAGEGTRSG